MSDSACQSPLINSFWPFLVCKTAVLRGLESLKVHLYKNHGIGEVFRCEDCNFETSVKTNYLKHLTTHSETPKKLRMCTKCGKAFKTRAGLRLHQMKHDGDGLSNVSNHLYILYVVLFM